MNLIEPIWERQEKESIQAYEAFREYMNLGSKRSLRLVGKKTGKTKACISKWSSKWEWVKRVFAYDNHLVKLEMEQKEIRIKEALKRHADTGELFQERTIEVLKELKAANFKNLTPLQLIRLFEIAVNIERDALGIAPIGEEVRLYQSGERLEIHKQLVESKIGNDLEDSSSFIDGIDKVSAEVWKN